MALPGVPTGKVKARPEGSATAGAMTRGSIPNCWAMPSATGMSSATTAEWLLASARGVPIAEVRASTWEGLCGQRLTVTLAIQPEAPEGVIAERRRIAPPFMGREPQFKYG